MLRATQPRRWFASSGGAKLASASSRGAAASLFESVVDAKSRKANLSLPPQKSDPFLRDGTVTSRFFRHYRTQLPFPLRMVGIFVLGFGLGLVIEIFACKTHLYESVMTKKDARRHEFDEFVVGFRENVEQWQKEDMMRKK